jgi:hypothetical protein
MTTTAEIVSGPEPVFGHPTPGMHIWGWMTNLELEWLYTTAQTMDSIVEVGSLHGRSAFALLKGCRGPVYAIDPWNDEHGKCLPSFLGYCGGFPNLVACQGYSPAVIDTYDIPDVDMVFIDGDHSEASVRADIEAWLPKTRKLICGHDYSLLPEGQAGYPDVRKVVDEMFGDRVRNANWLDTDFERYSIWAVDIEAL